MLEDCKSSSEYLFAQASDVGYNGHLLSQVIVLHICVQKSSITQSAIEKSSYDCQKGGFLFQKES